MMLASTPSDNLLMMQEERLQRRIAAAGTLMLPWAILVLTWLYTPSYIRPLLDHPATLPGSLTVALLTAMVFWMLQSTSSKLVWLLTILFFVVPLCPVPCIIPATLVVLIAK